jgi:hypothetical protein
MRRLRIVQKNPDVFNGCFRLLVLRAGGDVGVRRRIDFDTEIKQPVSLPTSE